jgi:hypothetical protein
MSSYIERSTIKRRSNPESALLRSLFFAQRNIYPIWASFGTLTFPAARTIGAGGLVLLDSRQEAFKTRLSRHSATTRPCIATKLYGAPVGAGDGAGPIG